VTEYSMTFGEHGGRIHTMTAGELEPPMPIKLWADDQPYSLVGAHWMDVQVIGFRSHELLPDDIGKEALGERQVNWVTDQTSPNGVPLHPGDFQVEARVENAAGQVVTFRGDSPCILRVLAPS
jgi:hypothetical protein